MTQDNGLWGLKEKGAEVSPVHLCAGDACSGHGRKRPQMELYLVAELKRLTKARVKGGELREWHHSESGWYSAGDAITSPCATRQLLQVKQGPQFSRVSLMRVDRISPPRQT